MDAVPDKTTKEKLDETPQGVGNDIDRMNGTSYLLGNPINAESLRISIDDAEAGKTVSVDLNSL